MRITLFIPCFVDSLMPQVGIAMVKHPATNAVGFTGSHAAGRALFDAAAARPRGP